MNKKKNNKGFTLVELIVVMAIMAILIGALAPQVVKYVEKARESKDVQLEQTLFTAVQTAINSSQDAVPDITASKLDALTATGANATVAKIGAEVKELMGSALDTDTEITAKCKSKKGSDTAGIVITYTASTGSISVKLGTLDPITN